MIMLVYYERILNARGGGKQGQRILRKKPLTAQTFYSKYLLLVRVVSDPRSGVVCG
jgi:hypothetical protein